MAVKRVRPQLGRDKDGNPDELAPRDTIEVFAHFTKEDGFFGLNAYLQYAAAQLKKNHGWADEAQRSQAARHSFPWRRIDDSHIDTEGFLKQSFEFTLDQAKILDLLTGHTLYNDTGVVVRELIQNSLDAIRLQRLLDEQSVVTPAEGQITIRWNSAERVLSVQDNGTGMTQQEIERHLLKIGSSKYEDSEFKKRFPAFSAISRFGIGVLSTFMIADSVEITTCHPNEPSARQLTLRSVHGRYLVRLLDKDVNAGTSSLCPHGTIVSLRIRPSANVLDIARTVEKWVVVPRCAVTLIIDDQAPMKMGFSSPKGALTDVLRRSGIVMESGGLGSAQQQVRIEEVEVEGVTVAYALRWSDYFREWTFLSLERRADRNDEPLLLGTCVEGVRVEPETPGFTGRNIAAIANASGLGSPRTNVARSGIETTPERDRMLRIIYKIYCDHIRSEMSQLQVKRSFSLTWAVGEAEWLMAPFYQQRGDGSDRFEPLSRDLLREAIRELPTLLIEECGERKAASPASLSSVPQLWTVTSAFFTSAEELLRETPGTGSVSEIMSALAIENSLPSGVLLCGSDRRVNQDTLITREVARIRVFRNERRIDLCWEPKSVPHRWVYFSIGRQRGSFSAVRMAVGTNKPEVEGRGEEAGVRVLGCTFIYGDTALARVLRPWFERQDSRDSTTGRFVIALVDLVERILNRRLTLDISTARRHLSREVEVPRDFDFVELLEAVEPPQNQLFDPAAWNRSYNELLESVSNSTFF
jgi:molecular chaperone HtpG